VSPTRARIVLSSIGISRPRTCVSHAREDGPADRRVVLHLSPSPLAREDGPSSLHSSIVIPISPPRAGMIRRLSASISPTSCVFHARGDGPIVGFGLRLAGLCLSRVQGWSSLWISFLPRWYVYPLRSWMVPSCRANPSRRGIVSPARGDGPAAVVETLSVYPARGDGPCVSPVGWDGP